MPARLTIDTRLRVMLDAGAPQGPLASQVLAAAAGIPLAEARARLSETPAALAGDLPAATARRLVRMLRVLGLQVRTEPAAQPRRPSTPRLDLALQWAGRGGEAPPLRSLAVQLGRTAEAVAEALSSPAGLVLPGLDAAAVGLWRRALKPLPGLRLVTSDPVCATYDLLPARDAAPDPELMLHLFRLGLTTCPLTGAIGAGLDLAMRDHVARRFPGAPVLAVNRDFQRFDVVLVAHHGLSAAELDGFLCTRVGPGLGICRPGRGAEPLCLDHALGRADALAFQSDYAAIGLETRLRLVWPDATRLS